MNKKNLLSVITVIFVIFFVDAKAQDSIAHRIIIENLTVINEYISSKYPKPQFSGWNSVYFLIKLTGIPSSAGGNTLGPNSPTEIDYSYWSNWYMLNKSYITWNEKLKVIVLRKEIVPPETPGTSKILSRSL